MLTNNATFPLLADPGSYVACPWDLTADDRRRRYWLDLFRHHFPSLLEAANRLADHDGVHLAEAQGHAAQAQDLFYAYLDAASSDPGRFGRLDIYQIDLQRECALRQANIDDPYRLAKQRETETALALLPEVIRQLDRLDQSRRSVELVRGIFAGNIFDLGATRTVEQFTDQPVDFTAVRANLKPRPWLLDDLDRWIQRLEGPPHRAAVLFVDNAGPDIVLGMIPFARDLLGRGTRVILSANSTPTLNDVTHMELVKLIERISAWDTVLRDAQVEGRLTMVSSGNGVPLLDLTRLSGQLVTAVQAEPVELVVLEGMGRAIETNLDARFTCDVLKVAMIKDEDVAEALGGQVYDLVFRFEPGA